MSHDQAHLPMLTQTLYTDYARCVGVFRSLIQKKENCENADSTRGVHRRPSIIILNVRFKHLNFVYTLFGKSR